MNGRTEDQYLVARVRRLLAESQEFLDYARATRLKTRELIAEAKDVAARAELVGKEKID
jgi:hypothetical protein